MQCASIMCMIRCCVHRTQGYTEHTTLCCARSDVRPEQQASCLAVERGAHDEQPATSVFATVSCHEVSMSMSMSLFNTTRTTRAMQPRKGTWFRFRLQLKTE
eukprot:7220592-Pyramimonas_sp.AAC.4